MERGVTLVGPHRDDLTLTLGELPAKGYASHGESWSFALALRLAAYDLLRADGIEPVLVLDDVFAELDTGRRERLADLVGGASQVLVTCAVDDDVPASLRGRPVRGRARVRCAVPDERAAHVRPGSAGDGVRADAALGRRPELARAGARRGAGPAQAGRPRRCPPSAALVRRWRRRRRRRRRRLRGYSGPGPDPRDPQLFGAVLAKLVKARGWQKPAAEATVFGAWERVVGPDIAAHSRPVKLEDGELTVEAESTAWATQLRLLAGDAARADRRPRSATTWSRSCTSTARPRRPGRPAVAAAATRRLTARAAPAACTP